MTPDSKSTPSRFQLFHHSQTHTPGFIQEVSSKAQGFASLNTVWLAARSASSRATAKALHGNSREAEVLAI